MNLRYRQMIIILHKIYLVVSPLMVTISHPTMTPNILESVCNRVRAPNPRYQSIATAAKVRTKEFLTISEALKSTVLNGWKLLELNSLRWIHRKLTRPLIKCWNYSYRCMKLFLLNWCYELNVTLMVIISKLDWWYSIILLLKIFQWNQ